MDGVDVALIETDGEARCASGRPASALRRATAPLLRAALAAAGRSTSAKRGPRRSGQGRGAGDGCPRRGRRDSSRARTRPAVDHRRLSWANGAAPPRSKADGPDRRRRALARALGLPVVADLRAADVAAGGQGAPLVPVYHRALATAAGLAGATLVINIGGVANITFVPRARDPIACDTGPGNALIDDLMLERTGGRRPGRALATGTVDATVLAQLLDHPFFALPPPKSLDRNAFSRAAVTGLTTADAAATLTAFTAASIAAVLRHLPGAPSASFAAGAPTIRR